MKFITLKKVWEKEEPNGMNLCRKKCYNKDSDKQSVLHADCMVVISSNFWTTVCGSPLLSIP
jgi:hypothetical protein